MLSPTRLVESVSERLSQVTQPLAVFWYYTEQSRTQLVHDIIARRGTSRIMPISVNSGFDNPNELLSDLSRLIAAHKQEFLDLFSSNSTAATKCVAIILLSRIKLSIPQIASPMMLPEWFPIFPNQITEIIIEDLLTSASCSLDSSECHIEELAEAVYTLDKILIECMLKTHEKDKRLTMSFFDLIKKDGEKIDTFLKECQKNLTSIKNPGGYRPSVKERMSLIARIMSLVSQKSPDELNKIAKSIMSALDLQETRCISFREPLFSVFFRSVNLDRSLAVKFSRSLLITIYFTSQLITAAAHSAEYPSYSATLLLSTSHELRLALTNIISVLETSPDGGAEDSEKAC